MGGPEWRWWREPLGWVVACCAVEGGYASASECSVVVIDIGAVEEEGGGCVVGDCEEADRGKVGDWEVGD